MRNRFGPESVYPIDLSFAELGRAFPVAAILYEVAKMGLTRLRERCGIEINPPCEGRAKCIDTSSIQAGENLRPDAGENQPAFGQAGKIEANGMNFGPADLEIGGAEGCLEGGGATNAIAFGFDVSKRFGAWVETFPPAALVSDAPFIEVH